MRTTQLRLIRGDKAGLGAGGKVGGRGGKTSWTPLPTHLLVLDDPVLVKVDEEDVAGHQAALLDDLVVCDIHHADLERWGGEGREMELVG